MQVLHLPRHHLRGYRRRCLLRRRPTHPGAFRLRRVLQPRLRHLCVTTRCLMTQVLRPTHLTKITNSVLRGSLWWIATAQPPQRDGTGTSQLVKRACPSIARFFWPVLWESVTIICTRRFASRALTSATNWSRRCLFTLRRRESFFLVQSRTR